MPEITEQELSGLRAAHKLMQDLLGDDTKPEFEALVKKKFPKVRTTADELAPAMNEIKKLNERFDALEARDKKKIDEELDSKFFAAIDDLKSNHGLTEPGVEKLKQVMKDKLIADPYAAFHHMRALEPKTQVPSAFTPTDWGFGRKTDDKDVQRLFEDPDGWASDEAARAWNDAANGRG